MSQTEQVVHQNRETRESVTFVSVRADDTTEALVSAANRLHDDTSWSELSIAYREGDNIYVVRASR